MVAINGPSNHFSFGSSKPRWSTGTWRLPAKPPPQIDGAPLSRAGLSPPLAAALLAAAAVEGAAGGMLVLRPQPFIAKLYPGSRVDPLTTKFARRPPLRLAAALRERLTEGPT